MLRLGKAVMRWTNRGQRTNLDDRRRMIASRGILGGGIGSLILILTVWLFGGNPLAFLRVLQTEAPQVRQSSRTPNSAEDELAKFVSMVLADTQDVWHQQFSQMGRTYKEPEMVLFTGRVQLACGFSNAAVGAFYCPPDQKVYIDLGFYESLKNHVNALPASEL